MIFGVAGTVQSYVSDSIRVEFLSLIVSNKRLWEWIILVSFVDLRYRITGSHATNEKNQMNTRII